MLLFLKKFKELASSDNSSTIQIFHCLYFLILVGWVFLITFFETSQFGLYKPSPAADRPIHSVWLVWKNCSLLTWTFKCCSKLSWREDYKYTTPRNSNILIHIQWCGHFWRQKVYNPHVSNQLNCWKNLRLLVSQQKIAFDGKGGFVTLGASPTTQASSMQVTKMKHHPQSFCRDMIVHYLTFISALKQMDIKYSCDFN